MDGQTERIKKILAQSGDQLLEALQEYASSYEELWQADAYPKEAVFSQLYVRAVEAARKALTELIGHTLSEIEERTLTESKKREYLEKGVVLKNNGRRERVLIGCFGRVSFSRTILIPADAASAALLRGLQEEERKGADAAGTNAGRSIFPMDLALGIAAIPFKMTPRFLCETARCAVLADSYGHAANLVEDRFQVSLSAVQVERVADYVGSYVWREQEQRALEAKKLENERTDGRKRRRRREDVLYLQLESVKVFLRSTAGEEGGWKELKHAVAFHSSDIHRYETKGETCYRVLSKEAVGYLGTAEGFKYHLLALAKRHDADLCTDVVILSDGSSWSNKIARELFPRAMYLLDLYYVKKAVWSYASAMSTDEKTRKELGERLCTLIEEGKLGDAVNEAEAFDQGKSTPESGNLRTFLLDHRQAMAYSSCGEKGILTGSDFFQDDRMQKRLRAQGMSWTDVKAQQMASLLAKYESGRWSEVETLIRRAHE